MSHSPNDAERAWDFGMVDTDLIAFPVCEPESEQDWTSGRLGDSSSYWRQKSWASWRVNGHINYFTVEAFRSRLHAKSRTKGVVEGSENFISWDATFSSRSGPVLAVDNVQRKVKIGLADGSRPYTWRIKEGSAIYVAEGDAAKKMQIIGAAVAPLVQADLACPAEFPSEHIHTLIGSRERTQRFTGVKLARLLGGNGYETEAQELANDGEEDVYVKLEAASYLVACCHHPAEVTFAPYLNGGDQQTQLEVVISLGEAQTPESIRLLAKLLTDDRTLYFLRSAAAWSLGQIGTEEAAAPLVAAFSSVDVGLRHEALSNLVAVGNPACNALLEGLSHSDESIVAGCAESLRQQDDLSQEVVEWLAREVCSDYPSRWVVWLVGHLPRDQFASAVAQLRESRPELHYALSLLWSFVESWIATHWELNASTGFSC